MPRLKVSVPFSVDIDFEITYSPDSPPITFHFKAVSSQSDFYYKLMNEIEDEKLKPEDIKVTEAILEELSKRIDATIEAHKLPEGLDTALELAESLVGMLAKDPRPKLDQITLFLYLRFCNKFMIITRKHDALVELKKQLKAYMELNQTSLPESLVKSLFKSTSVSSSNMDESGSVKNSGSVKTSEVINQSVKFNKGSGATEISTSYAERNSGMTSKKPTEESPDKPPKTHELIFGIHTIDLQMAPESKSNDTMSIDQPPSVKPKPVIQSTLFDRLVMIGTREICDCQTAAVSTILKETLATNSTIFEAFLHLAKYNELLSNRGRGYSVNFDNFMRHCEPIVRSMSTFDVQRLFKIDKVIIDYNDFEKTSFKYTANHQPDPNCKLVHILNSNSFLRMINNKPKALTESAWSTEVASSLYKILTSRTTEIMLDYLCFVHLLGQEPQNLDRKLCEPKTLRVVLVKTFDTVSNKFSDYFADTDTFRIFLKALSTAESLLENSPLPTQKIVEKMVGNLDGECSRVAKNVILNDNLASLQKLRKVYKEDIDKEISNSIDSNESANQSLSENVESFLLESMMIQEGPLQRTIEDVRRQNNTKKNHCLDFKLKNFWSTSNGLKFSVQTAQSLVENADEKLVKDNLFQMFGSAIGSKEDVNKLYGKLKGVLGRKAASIQFLSNLHEASYIPFAVKEELEAFNLDPTVRNLEKVDEFRNKYEEIDQLVRNKSDITLVLEMIDARMKANLPDLNKALRDKRKECTDLLKKSLEQVSSEHSPLITAIKKSKDNLIQLNKVFCTRLLDKVIDQSFINFALYELSSIKDHVKSSIEIAEKNICEVFHVRNVGYSAELDKLVFVKVLTDETIHNCKSIWTLAQQALTNKEVIDTISQCSGLICRFGKKLSSHFKAMESFIVSFATSVITVKTNPALIIEAKSIARCVEVLGKIVAYFRSLTPGDKDLMTAIKGLLEIQPNLEIDLKNIHERAERIEWISKLVINSETEDFKLLNILFAESTVRFDIDHTSKHYVTNFRLKRADDAKYSIEQVQHLMANYKQIALYNLVQQMPEMVDYQTMMGKIEKICQMLDAIRKVGATLTIKKIFKDLPQEFMNFPMPSEKSASKIAKTFEINFAKMRNTTSPNLRSKQNPQIFWLQKIENELSNFIDLVTSQNQALERDNCYKWILKLTGEERECLALYASKQLGVNPDKINVDIEAVSIIQYYNLIAGHGSKKITNENILALSTTTDIIKCSNFEDNSKVEEPISGKQKSKMELVRLSTLKYWTFFQYLHKNGIETIEASQLLLVNHTFTEEMIENFLNRASVNNGGHYFIMDVQLLSVSLLDSLVRIFHMKTQKCGAMPKITVFCAAEECSNAYKRLTNTPYSNDFENVWKDLSNTESDFSQANDQLKSYFAKIKVRVVDSDFAGLGKSHYIRHLAKQRQKTLAHLVLSGESCDQITNKRLEVVSNELDNSRILVVKLDMMDNMFKNADLVDQQLFKICYLKCIKYNEGYLFFDKLDLICIEVSNNYRNIILEKMPFVSMIANLPPADIKSNLSFRHTVPKMDALKVSDITFEPPVQIMVNNVCAIYEMIRNGAYAEKNLFMVEQWQQVKDRIENYSTDDSNAVEEMEEGGSKCKKYLMQMFQYSPDGNKRSLSDSTMSQLVCLIKVLHSQFMGLESVFSLNMEFVRHKPEELKKAQEIEDTIPEIVKDVRISLANILWQLCNQFVWANTKGAKSLQRDSVKNMSLALHSPSKKGLEESRIQALKELESIEEPTFDWKDESRFNLFFTSEGIIKFLYREAKDVPRSLRVVLHYQEDQLKDYNEMTLEDQEIELLNQLILSFDIKANDLLLECGIENKELSPDKWRVLLAGTDPKLAVLLKQKLDKIKGESSYQDIMLILMMYKKKNFATGYTLSHENFLKMMLIYQRVSAGLSPIIIGPTGCGKSYLIRFFFQEILRYRFFEISMHMGVTENEFEDKLGKIVAHANDVENKIKEYTSEITRLKKYLLQDDGRKVQIEERINKLEAELNPIQKQPKFCVFFDEFNTSPLQSLIEEIVISRTANFSSKLKLLCTDHGRFNKNISFVAACNPCRIKVNRTTTGLAVLPNDNLLVNQVFPIPESMMNGSFDFGNIKEDTKWNYIVVYLSDLQASSERKKMLARCITTAQAFITKLEDNDSAVSMRDINRVVHMYKWLKVLLAPINTDEKIVENYAMVCTISLCYILRTANNQKRAQLDKELQQELKEYNLGITSFEDHFIEATTKLTSDMKSVGAVPSELSINQALRENIFATLVAVGTMLPVILIGKPGTSKTLSVSLVKDFMANSLAMQNSKYFKNMPNAIFKELVGTENLTSKDVLDHEEACVKESSSYSQLGLQKRMVFVFDEIGVAEMSTSDPLKVLHSILEPSGQRRYSIIGISNWTLDLSKMNRVIVVPRPDLDLEDLKVTLKISEIEHINTSKHKQTLNFLMEQVASTYLEFIKLPGNENFFGYRDIYHLRKMIQRHVQAFSLRLDKEASSSYEANNQNKHLFRFICFALYRNFSGRKVKKSDLPDLPDKPSAEVFCNILLGKLKSLKLSEDDKEFSFSTIDLIKSNLLDQGSRHMKIIVEKPWMFDAIEKHLQDVQNLMPSSGSMQEAKVKESLCLAGSSFKNNQSLMDSVQICLKEGVITVLKNWDTFYGNLIDILNQKYFKQDEDGHNLVYLHIGSIKTNQLVPVHKNFRLITLMEAADESDVKQTKLAFPKLNRSEKHLLSTDELLSSENLQIIAEIFRNLKELMGKLHNPEEHKIFNFGEDMLKGMLVSILHDQIFGSPKPLSQEDFFNLIISPPSRVPQNSLSNAEKSKRLRLDVIRFYRRKMVESLKRASLLTPEIEEEYKQTHPIANFEQLITNPALDSCQKAVIYSMQNKTKLDECIKSLNKPNSTKLAELMSIEVFLEIPIELRVRHFEKLLDRTTLVAISICGVSLWRHSVQVRSVFDQMTIPEGKCAVVILIYENSDLDKKPDFSCAWYGYPSSGWKVTEIQTFN